MLRLYQDRDLKIHNLNTNLPVKATIIRPWQTGHKMDRHLPLPAVKNEDGAAHWPETSEICQDVPPVSGYVEAETSIDREKNNFWLQAHHWQPLWSELMTEVEQ